MKSNYSKITILLISAVLIGIVGCLFFYFEIWVPRKTIQDTVWWERSSPEEKRQLAHQILKYPIIGIHHDAFLILVDHGNKESIPYLLNSLKWYEFFNKDEGFTVCTKDHCLEALRKVTGKDLGTNYVDWQYIENHKPADTEERKRHVEKPQ